MLFLCNLFCHCHVVITLVSPVERIGGASVIAKSSSEQLLMTAVLQFLDCHPWKHCQSLHFFLMISGYSQFKLKYYLL